MTGWEQLKLLQAFSRTTGALHEAQILQLKAWPRVAFAKLIKHEVTWNIVTKKVIFNVYLQEKIKVLKEFTTRCRVLSTNVKEMLGDDWAVRIDIAGKMYFKASGKKCKTK